MVVLRHRRLLAVLAIAVAVLAGFVLLYFRPQKLFIDDEVHEALPVAGAPDQPDGKPTTRVVSSGQFRSYEHATSGRARILELPGGRRYVRLEPFRTSNGPALKVYLSAAPASGPGDAFDDRYRSLGDRPIPRTSTSRLPAWTACSKRSAAATVGTNGGRGGSAFHVPTIARRSRR